MSAGAATDLSLPKLGLLRALGHRNYRLFFIGNGLSLIGTWMTSVATAWLVYRLTGGEHSAKAAVWLGYVVFASQAPLFLLTPFTGVLVDRMDKRKIMVATQALSLLQSTALATLAYSGHATPESVLLLAVAQGLINSFDVPARQSFVVELVDGREDFANAIAMNSMMFNSARLVGPAAAGIIIANSSEAWCFAFDAVSYLAVLISLLMMRLAPRAIAAHHASLIESLREGFRYAFGFSPIRTLIAMVAVMSFAGAALPTLLPLFADALTAGHGATVFGWLSSAIGIGALGGGIYLASRRTVVGLGKVITIAGGLYAIALAAFAISPTLWLAAPVLAFLGVGMMVLMAGSNTILQSIADDDKRGRLMSFFSMAVMGMSPFGALVAGRLAAATSPKVTLLCAAAACAVAISLFAMKLTAMRPLVRDVYARKGILRAVAVSIDAIDETQAAA